ncbi:hypothetical protein DPMN_076278 [Dreissena polymorpha]|uniref:Uncharacterized protein n=1 Tax=Dreissena polymorpha TaxID=45954 RepID=A0A9D4BFM3_DREPO|nr:hypothetical protein DPMN_076278 [Dreissena polymorpha]
MILDFTLLISDYHPVCGCSFIKPVGEVFQFTAGATHKVNAISETLIEDRSETDGDGRMVVFEGLVHFSFKEKVKQTSLTDAQ